MINCNWNLRNIFIAYFVSNQQRHNSLLPWKPSLGYLESVQGLQAWQIVTRALPVRDWLTNTSDKSFIAPSLLYSSFPPPPPTPPPQSKPPNPLRLTNPLFCPSPFLGAPPLLSHLYHQGLRKYRGEGGGCGINVNVQVLPSNNILKKY